MAKITINGRELEGEVYVTIDGVRIGGLVEGTFEYKAPDPIADIQRACELAWRGTSAITHAWCTECGRTVVECAAARDCVFRPEMFDAPRAGAPAWCTPPPSESPPPNRHERRAAKARRRRGRSAP